MGSTKKRSLTASDGVRNASWELFSLYAKKLNFPMFRFRLFHLVSTLVKHWSENQSYDRYLLSIR